MNFNSLFIFILYCFKYIILLSNEKLNEIEKKMILKDSNDNSKINQSKTKLLFDKVFNTINNMIEEKYKKNFSKLLTKHLPDEKGIYYFIIYYHSQQDNYDENIYFLRSKAFGNVNNLDENITVYELEEIKFEDFIFPNEILEQQIKMRINEYHINKYHIKNYKYNFIKKSFPDNFDLIRIESDDYGPHYYYYLLFEYGDKVRISFSAKTPKYLIY